MAPAHQPRRHSPGTGPGLRWLLSVVLAVWPAAAAAQRALVGSLDGPAETVVVSGSHAYVSAGAELRVIDVADPTSPVQVGAFTAPDLIYGFAAAGGTHARRHPGHARLS